MAKEITVHLPRGQRLTITADAVSDGKYIRLDEPGGANKYDPVAVAASSSTIIGPFDNPRYYKLLSENGELSYALANDGLITDAEIDAKEPIIPANNAGTAATNVTAVEYGDDYQKTSVLTVSNAVLPAITGGAAESEGVLLYTLPAGACVVKQAYMTLAIQQQDGNITADTPEVGLGTTIGSGANATLGAVDAAAENIITAQVAADCDGAATVKTIADQVLVVETGGDHTIYFNVADTWAASGDTGALVSGTVVLHWQFIA
jgi:hypothetical protein